MPAARITVVRVIDATTSVRHRSTVATQEVGVVVALERSLPNRQMPSID